MRLAVPPRLIAGFCTALTFSWLLQLSQSVSTTPTAGSWDPLGSNPIESGEDFPANAAGAAGVQRAAVYAGSSEPVSIVDGTVSHPGVSAFDQGLSSDPKATFTWLFRVQHTLPPTTSIPMQLRYRLSVSAGGDATIPGNAGPNAIAKGILDLVRNVSGEPRIKYLLCYAGTYHVDPDPSNNFCQDRTDDANQANWLPIPSSGVVSFAIQGSNPELALRGHAIVNANVVGYNWNTQGPKAEQDWGTALTRACLSVDPSFPQADQVQVTVVDGVGSSVFVPLNCTLIDYDRDGFKEDVDCNDSDASVYPGAVETYDGRDNNCNGVVDEDSTPPQITAPQDITAECKSQVGTAVNLGVPAVSDNMPMAPPPNVTNNAPALFPLGRTKVTWTATDVQGNEASVDQWVTIRDTFRPRVTVGASPLREGLVLRPNMPVTGRLYVSAFDVCDPAPALTITINSIPVTNGQRIRLEPTLSWTTYWGHDPDGTLWIRARRFTLRITATDASGNRVVVTKVAAVT